MLQNSQSLTLGLKNRVPTSTIGRSQSDSSLYTLPNQQLQADTLELSKTKFHQLEQAARLEEQSGDYDAASGKYKELLKYKIVKYGEDSLEAGEVRARLIPALVKAGKQIEADYQKEHLRLSIAKTNNGEQRMAMERLLSLAEQDGNKASETWLRAVEAKLTAKRQIQSKLEQQEKATYATLLEEAQLKETQEKQKYRLQARQAQREKYISLATDLQGLKLSEIENLGFYRDAQIKKIYDEDDAQTLLKFNHGEPLSLSCLPDSARLPFTANIEELLTKIPKRYEVTPSGSGTPVQVKEAGDMLPSRVQKHIIAEKALRQWKMATTQEDEEAWAKQVKEWFGKSPSELEEECSPEISLYDLFMHSEQNKGLESLAGMQDVKNYLLSHIIAPIFDAAERQGYRGIILYGEPGNGKTALTTALARHTGFNLYHVRRGDLESTYKNGVPETIAKTLKHARDHQPSIVILEEVDSIAASRDGHQSADGADAKETTAIMNGIDQLIEDDAQVILMATTNYRNKLDKAFRREGRFHDEIEIHNPDQELREYLFKTYLKRFNNAEELATKAAELSDGLSSAAIRTVCEYDLANDSKIQSRFRKTDSVSISKNLSFEKLKECIEKRCQKQ